MKKGENYYDNKHIDDVGRIVLPKPLRDRIGIISEETPLQIYSEDDKIIIKPYIQGCVICGKTENTFELKGKKICIECIEKLNKIIELNK